MCLLLAHPHLITKYRTGTSPHRCLINSRRHPPLSSIITSSAACIDAAHSIAVAPVAARWRGPQLRPNSLPAFCSQPRPQ